MKRISFSNYTSGRIDKQLLFVVIGMLIFGIVMVFDASVVDATRSFGDKFFYAKRQVFWAVLGMISLFVFSKISYRNLKQIALPLMVVTVVSLVLVLIPGFRITALGAKRWIGLGPVVYQPAELAKLAFALYFARIFSEKKSLAPFFFWLAVLVGLIMLEPDLGSASIITFSSMIMYFVSGEPILYFLGIVPLATVAGFVLTLTSSYRKERLLTFLNSSADPLGSSYQIRQVLIALGSGGIWGLGLGQSRQKYLFLPEPATDSIFAIIGEELGFIGTSIVLVAFLFLVWRGLLIAKQVPDPFGKLLALGITSWIGIQAFINLSAMVAMVPLTGVPLPLISYGGSSLILTLSGIGILLNISRERNMK